MSHNEAGPLASVDVASAIRRVRIFHVWPSVGGMNPPDGTLSYCKRVMWKSGEMKDVPNPRPPHIVQCERCEMLRKKP